MPKPKFYVVWEGHQPGVYDNWNVCKKQIHNYPKAIYKSFETLAAAKQAFDESYLKHIGQGKTVVPSLSKEKLALIGKPILNSIAVDGGCSGATGLADYQGVHVETKTHLFRKGPFADGTNNIVEFLAIVHALAFCKEKNWQLPIYSDSKIALSWIKQKKCKTNHKPSAQNKVLFDLIHRAELWLHNNTYQNQLLKWETKAWGEIPADFNRK
ncbi:MAG: viroplasmin family protein [Flavobacterium sp.]